MGGEICLAGVLLSILEGAVGYFRHRENVREERARIRDTSGYRKIVSSASAWAIQYCEDNQVYSRETRRSSPLRSRDWFNDFLGWALCCCEPTARLLRPPSRTLIVNESCFSLSRSLWLYPVSSIHSASLHIHPAVPRTLRTLPLPAVFKRSSGSQSTAHIHPLYHHLSPLLEREGGSLPAQNRVLQPLLRHRPEAISTSVPDIAISLLHRKQGRRTRVQKWQLVSSSTLPITRAMLSFGWNPVFTWASFYVLITR